MSRPALRDRIALREHIREARTRLIWSGAALAVAAVAGFLLADLVLDVLRAPILDIAESRNASLNYSSVTGAFDLKLRITLILAIVLSSPMWLYQLLAFLAPALTRREKRYGFGFLAAALVLFTVGCTAGVLLFPHMVTLLTGFASVDDSTLLQASDYVDFVLKVVVAIGVAFTLPVLVVMLNFLGMLSAATIARSWRIALVGIFVFSALVTPAADALSMFLVAVPMIALSAAGYLIARAHDRAAARRAAALVGDPSLTPVLEEAR